MTQILTAATPYYIVQVSDRLVTVARGAGSRVHDPMANKTVVYRAKDALVTIGYSGIAYIGRSPTDEWIAERLYGAALPRGPDDRRPCMGFGCQKHHWNIGYATKRLEEGFRSLPAMPVDKYGLYLTMAGWQFNRAGARPILVEISRVAGKTWVSRSPRVWPKSSSFRIAGIGANLPAGAIDAALAPHRKSESFLLPETLEGILADLIRTTSAQEQSVGSHLLSVVLMRPDLAFSACRFLPSSPHLVQITTATREIVTAAAHTPWILGGGLVHPPSFEIGDSELSLSGLPFRVIGTPAGDNGILGLSSSLERPARP